MLISRTWLQDFFDEKVPSPDEIADALTFGAFEIDGVEKRGGDTVIDVDVLPNRSSDCLSHRGVAREVSTLMGISMTKDPLAESMLAAAPVLSDFTVEVTEEKRSPVYIAAKIKRIKVGPSPDWLKERLEAVGQKSINNVVDATNYVMFTLGTPLHAFDGSKISEGIVVRPASLCEKITLLGGEDKELAESMTVIGDKGTGEALALAGVKGGIHAELTDSTTEVVLEAATFDPVITRKTAAALNTRTDASKRFENEVPNELPAFGMKMLVDTVLDVAGGELVGFAATDIPEPTERFVEFSVDHTNRLLGTKLSEKEVMDMLNKLSFEHTCEDGICKVSIPFERLDLQIPEDMIEEVGRVYGYRNLEGVELPPLSTPLVINPKQYASEVIRKTLGEAGYAELLTYSLRDSGDLKLVNSLAADKDHLRVNLSDGVSEKLQEGERNAPLLGLHDGVFVFEIGNVFSAKDEHTSCALGVWVPGKKKRVERIKEELEKAQTLLEGALGTKLKDAKFTEETLEWNVTKTLEGVTIPNTYPDMPHVEGTASFSPISQYPFVLRDIALWVPGNLTPEEVAKVVVSEAGPLMVRIDLFDQFEKDGRTSFAFHMVFQSHEATLTDEEVGTYMDAVEKCVSKEGWEVR